MNKSELFIIIEHGDAQKFQEQVNAYVKHLPHMMTLDISYQVIPPAFDPRDGGCMYSHIYVAFITTTKHDTVDPPVLVPK